MQCHNPNPSLQCNFYPCLLKELKCPSNCKEYPFLIAQMFDNYCCRCPLPRNSMLLWRMTPAIVQLLMDSVACTIPISRELLAFPHSGTQNLCIQKFHPRDLCDKEIHHVVKQDWFRLYSSCLQLQCLCHLSIGCGQLLLS